MTLSLIAAVASNGVIGMGGGIPWHIPDDMAYFKSITMGHRVIMGRNTYESLPGTLKGRQNVIVSKSIFDGFSSVIGNGETVVSSIESALSMPQWGEHEEVFCIGGAKLYGAMLPLADKLYLTEIMQDFEGDTFFPEYNKDEWIQIRKDKYFIRGINFSFSVYERKK